MIKIALLAGLLLALSACGGVSGDKNSAGPFPEYYEPIIRGHLNSSLKDPYSVQGLVISRPVQKALWTGLVNSGNVQTWASCVSYNAKNSFGAYVGHKSYTYYFHNGSIINTSPGC